MKNRTEGSGVLLTGGSGLLGRHLIELFPDMTTPTSSEFDITDFDAMNRFARSMEKTCVVVHAAAYTKTHQADQEILDVIEKNIIGTCNIVRLCAMHDWRLIYISTDYVFKGNHGNYTEDDEVLPTGSYAWSKLGGECAARMYPKSLVVRASFGPEPFPCGKAFRDQWTSKIGVREFAARLIHLILADNLVGVIHVGSRRRTMLEYARSISGDKKIESSSRLNSDLAFPQDTSLDCGKYHRLFEE